VFELIVVVVVLDDKVAVVVVEFDVSLGAEVTVRVADVVVELLLFIVDLRGAVGPLPLLVDWLVELLTLLLSFISVQLMNIA